VAFNPELDGNCQFSAVAHLLNAKLVTSEEMVDVIVTSDLI